MTIRKGESYVFESFSQFQNRLNVDWEEIATALPEEPQSELLEIENQLREENDDPPIDDVTKVHKDTLVRFVHDHIGITSAIIHVLESRDREYTHVLDNSVHRVIELYPEDAL